MTRPAFLYVIADGSGAHKVGLSVAPQRRLAALQSGSPRRLRIARQSPAPAVAAGPVEAYAHWLLREACALGEWFNVTEEAAWVALVAAAEAVEAGATAPRWREGGGPGRKLRYPDKIIAPLPAGSIKRMEAVLAENEDKTDLLREAVVRELERREAMSARERTKLKPD